jgi:hypothetical protein
MHREPDLLGLFYQVENQVTGLLETRATAIAHTCSENTARLPSRAPELRQEFVTYCIIHNGVTLAAGKVHSAFQSKIPLNLKTTLLHFC